MIKFKVNETHPDYKVCSINSKSKDYCLAIFVLNEGTRLHRQLEVMNEADIHDYVDIIIADGGSTDGSIEADCFRQFNICAILKKIGSGRLGAQMRMAFHWAITQGYNGVVVIDGNGKDGVSAIPKFVSLLKEGFDHIQGSRFISGGFHENTPKTRLWGLKLLHVPLIRLASGFKYTDTTNGFRGYSKRVLLDERLDIFRSVFTGYELHYYIAVKAPKVGFNCVETPVSRVYPKYGKTPTKISPVWGNLKVLLKLLAVCTGRYDPP